jgi:hypothetical protein
MVVIVVWNGVHRGGNRLQRGKDDEAPTAANGPKDWGPAEISIVGLTGEGDEASDSAQEDLVKRFPNYTFTFLERIQPGKVKERIAGGTQMDIVSTSVGEILATADLFDKFGVPYPKDGMTWDDALAAWGHDGVEKSGNSKGAWIGHEI